MSEAIWVITYIKKGEERKIELDANDMYGDMTKGIALELIKRTNPDAQAPIDHRWGEQDVVENQLKYYGIELLNIKKIPAK